MLAGDRGPDFALPTQNLDVEFTGSPFIVWWSVQDVWKPEAGRSDASLPTRGQCKYPMMLAFFIRRPNSSHGSRACADPQWEERYVGVPLFSCPTAWRSDP